MLAGRQQSKAVWRRVAAVTLGVILLGSGLAACAPGEDEAPEALEPLYEVSEATISQEATQGVRVFSPVGEGSWPVVHFIPGGGGGGEDAVQTARTLAAQGVVVFVPSHRSVYKIGSGPETEADVVCGWRFAESVAGEYGGDLDQPVTLAGHDLGAELALDYGLREEGNPDVACFTPAPAPNVVVAIGACTRRLASEVTDWSNTTARTVLVTGSNDKICPSSVSETFTEELQSSGFDATFVRVDGGDHNNVVFIDFRFAGRYQARDSDAFLTDHPAGTAVVQTILDAIDAAR